MRVVSLTCSNTEIVCALGMGHTLVGVDDHSDHPPDVLAGLPRVGPDLGIDIDAVVALRPDLVIASLTVPGHEKVVDALHAAGLPLLVPEPTQLEHLGRDVRAIARALGVSGQGEALAATLDAGLQPLPPPSVRPRILVEWWPKPVIVPGHDSWVTELIWRAGGVNPLADDPCKSRPITDDEARALAPDAVVISWCGVPLHRYRRDIVQKRTAWADTPALRHDRIVPISEAFLGRPGPRLVEGLQRLRAVVDAVTGG